MSTTGKRYHERTHDRSSRKVLDARTRTVLRTVLQEPRGRSLDAWLLARTVR